MIVEILKNAVKERRVQVGIVMVKSVSELNVQPFDDDLYTVIALSPQIGQVRAEAIPKTGYVAVTNQVSSVVPFLVAVVPKSAVPHGVAALVLPPFAELAKIVGSKINLSLGSLFGK